MLSDNYFYYKKSRLNQIRGFCAVVQNGCSGVKGAEKLCVEPATICKQIKTLERDLGVQLFDRSQPHKLTLTKEGKLFYKLAVEQLQGINNLFNNFNNYMKEVNNSCLNLALHYTAASYIFPKIIGKLLKQSKFNNLKIKIFNITKEEAFKKLINKEIDLAFYPLDEYDIIPPEIESQRSIKSKNAIIFNINNPLAKKDVITKEDLEKINFLLRDVSYSFKINNFINFQKSNIIFENALIETTIELVKYTDTITAIPEIVLDKENVRLHPNIVAKNIDHLLPSRYFYILTLKNFLVKDSAKWVLNEIKSLTNDEEDISKENRLEEDSKNNEHNILKKVKSNNK